MTEKLDLNFMKKIQRSMEPSIKPGETAIEAIKRMENERVASMMQNPAPPTQPPKEPVQEVIFYQGYKLPRDFFTCVALCIIKLNNPEINQITEAFGFKMTDLDGKPVVFERKVKKLKSKSRRTSRK